MTSNVNLFPKNFTKIDGLIRGDHCYLNADDFCVFLGEYTAGGGYEHGATNHLIHNFGDYPPE